MENYPKGLPGRLASISGDVSHLEDYEAMITNMAAMARKMAGMVTNQSTGSSLESPLSLFETRFVEDLVIKVPEPGNYYFLQHQQNPVNTRSYQPADHRFNVDLIRKDFPILQEEAYTGKPLVWLDNAATTQKPNQVIDTISDYYRKYNSNVHRGAHAMAARATDAYEQARKKVAFFMGAAQDSELVFVRGTTEGINLVARTFGSMNVGYGDEIILSGSSHHANIVPWQMLANEKGAQLQVIPFNERGELDIETFKKLLNRRVKVVAVDHVSNVLGTINPIREITALAHAHGAIVVIDGAQAVSHIRPDMQEIDCDFYAFSGHKLFGPTGIGVVYGKAKHWDTIPPYQGGGNMIDKVTFSHTTYQAPPYKFEAGTANIADAIGLGAALDYIQQIGFEAAVIYEKKLLDYGMQQLATIPGLRLIGTSPTKVSVISFVIDGVANEAMGKYLDTEGIAVRSGHHCAQPALAYYGLASSVRPSVAFYNTFDEVDFLVDTVKKGIKSLKR